MTDKAIVYCDMPNGLQIELGEKNGAKTTVVLQNGRNEVAGDLWADWLEEHKSSSLVVDRHVYEDATEHSKDSPDPGEVQPTPEAAPAAPKE